MTVSADTFQEYLAPDESVRNAVPGTLVDDSHRSAGTIGVTDRRVLFVSGETFLDVTHDSVLSIRSRPKTTLTSQGTGFLLLAAVGVLLAGAGLVSVVLLEPSVPTVALLSVLVGGLVGAEYARRKGFGLAWSLPDGDSALDRLRGLDVRVAKPSSNDASTEALVLAVATGALLAAAGLVALTRSLLVLPLSTVALGGIAMTTNVGSRFEALERAGKARRREREVSVHLVDGRVVRFRVDPTSHIDRDLSGLARTAVGSDERPALPD